MKLGDKIYFIDESYIRQAYIVGISETQGFVDFLSSSSNEVYSYTKYTVCLKYSEFKELNEREVFWSIDAIKAYLAEKEFNKFSLVE